MVHANVLLNDGSNLLLNDGSKVLLNSQGVDIIGTHPTPALAVRPRGRQLIPVEFTFWIRAFLKLDVFWKVSVRS